MIVKEILKDCALLLDRDDLNTYLNNGVADDYVTASKDASVLLNAYNIVSQEISSEYLKLEYVETFSVKDGRVSFEKFKYTPLIIRSVKDKKGNKIAYQIEQGSIYTNFNEIEVTYVYSFPKKSLNDLTGYELTPITSKILQYGTLTEYLLIKGLYEEASLYNSKYVDALSNAINKSRSQKVKCREWI